MLPIEMRVLVWLLRHFAETVPLAQLRKSIDTELLRRAEYALRYQIHSPSQWHFIGTFFRR